MATLQRETAREEKREVNTFGISSWERHDCLHQCVHPENKRFLRTWKYYHVENRLKAKTDLSPDVSDKDCLASRKPVWCRAYLFSMEFIYIIIYYIISPLWRSEKWTAGATSSSRNKQNQSNPV